MLFRRFPYGDEYDFFHFFVGSRNPPPTECDAERIFYENCHLHGHLAGEAYEDR